METTKEKEKHATFTPGPWEKATIGIGTTAKQVVWLGENTGKQVQVIGTGRDHANARLIASAPEMYELLVRASKGNGYDSLSLAMDARELLAKVEGGEG